MPKNYFRIAWRNMLKNRLFSLINLLGLAVGMTFALIIGLWVKHEMSYDTFHDNRDRIAIILKNNFFNNEKSTDSSTPLPLYDELKSAYPEVKRLTRLDWGSPHSLRVEENKFNLQGFYADPDFLRMFTFPLVQGDRETALDEPNSIVLTESAAAGLFGNNDPTGKIVRMDNQYDLIVTGVAKDVPKNSTLDFAFLVPFEHSIRDNDWVRNAKTQWGNNFIRTIVELNESAALEAFSTKIRTTIQTQMNDPSQGSLFLHPLTKWHLHGEFKDWVNVGGKITYVRLFAIVGLLVLLIACFNFMNLCTARSEKRAKEVGIRKTIGSQRGQLIGQFLTESLLTAFIAFLLSLELLSLVLPFLKDLGFEHISADFTNVPLLLVVFAASVLTGLLAGSYPALYLSSFAPVRVLKGALQMGKAAVTPRRILVVAQFTFSITLMICTVIEKYNPAYPFEYRFVDQEFQKKFTTENQIGKLAAIFTGLAIFISCLGLFGLAAYMAESRTKEIGVRKVLGATVANLCALLSKDFITLVLISCLLASPLAVWLMKSWLEYYQYRVEIAWWVPLLAGGLALFIAIITVSYQAIRAALANPVEALRYE
jgi:ABC-type antimicrobial peptide transport system permease subunit